MTLAPSVELLDHRRIDWDRVERVSFLLRQLLKYDYDGPISRLRHRLMVVPMAVHGDQRRVTYGLEARRDPVELTESIDGFGNHRADIRADHMDQGMEFDAWAVVERSSADGPTRMAAATLRDPRLLAPTSLTWPDEALTSAARRLSANGETGVALARTISDWVYGVMRYRHDVTNVGTTAARALGLAQGVCQDYTHVMLAICRLSGLPARYVSGHLLGEGGSHAWVEVLVPAADGAGGVVAVAFDPTNGRRAGMNYLTVAVGRDYADVAPTSGTYQGTPVGLLTTSKRLGVTAVHLRP